MSVYINGKFSFTETSHISHDITPVFRNTCAHTHIHMSIYIYLDTYVYIYIAQNTVFFVILVTCVIKNIACRRWSDCGFERKILLRTFLRPPKRTNRMLDRRGKYECLCSHATTSLYIIYKACSRVIYI